VRGLDRRIGQYTNAKTARKVRIGTKVRLRECTERGEKRFFAAPLQHKARLKCCFEPFSQKASYTGVLEVPMLPG
jgi:hypothetical protein